ncbi:hypothetical protein [Parapedomonas caeni]
MHQTSPSNAQSESDHGPKREGFLRVSSYEIDDEIEALITKTVNILGLDINIVNQIYGEAIHRLFEICEMKIKTK